MSDLTAAHRTPDVGMVAALIRGEATIFGMRVTLNWPDGLPPGYTEDSLRALFDRISPRGNDG